MRRGLVVQIQWCLKGIPEQFDDYGNPTFSDIEAKALLYSGILSRAVQNNFGKTFVPAIHDAHDELSDTALNDHVNNFPKVWKSTPYISLSAGNVLPNPVGRVSVLPAWLTAAAFATNYGRTSGYVYRCWCVVSPKAVPEIASVADEVRDLNIFRKYWIFHGEGEIAAKLIVPARQIERVHKIDKNTRPLSFNNHPHPEIFNPKFIAPDRLSNLVEAIT